MASQILMPALSPTMTEGKIAAWLKVPGDQVRSGDVLAEIETDKASMEFEAADDGILGPILVPAGTEGIAVNTPIATLLAEGETAAPAAPPPVAAPSAPAPAPAPGEKPADRTAASPLARRMADQAGLDLGKITGTGPQGRVVKADIEALMPRPAAPAAVVVAAPAAGPGARALADLLGLPYRLEPMSSMRKTIARRLTESKRTVPHFYLSVDIAVDALLALRARLNAKAEGFKLSVNDFVIRAAALALKQVPAANASYDDSGILAYERADISVAVATPSGLITPIVKGAETRGLADISATMKDLAARAREGRLKPEEYQGGTFSISNLGMFGVRQFEAVINPPQGCILAVGASEPRAVARDNAVVIATMMTCTLSVDHRVVDGAVGTQWLQAFKGLIETPETMLL